jgi:DNA polymerase
MPTDHLSEALSTGLTAPRLIVDVETRSEVDLAVVGHECYARHPSTDVICVSIGRLNGDVVLNFRQPYLWWHDAFIQTLGLTAAELQHVLWLAYNAPFDRAIWEHILTVRYGWPPAPHWECLMQRAAYFNLPGGLDGVARVLGTPAKDAEGHRLMLRLCKPQRAVQASNDPWRLHTPENVAALARYCDQDVRAEAPLDHRLPRLPACELPVVQADRAMNTRGIRVDWGLADRMTTVALDYSQLQIEQMRTLTHGAVQEVTQLPAMREWLVSRGLPLRTGAGALDRYAIDAFLEGEDYDGNPLPQALDEDVRAVLSIRRRLAKSSLAKLKALRAATCADSRVRGMFQYYGADRTGRWAGRIIQPQNLPRGVLQGAEAYSTAVTAILARSDAELIDLLYGDQTMDVLASCLRSCLTASPGNVLVVSDYNAIECRMAAWLANEDWLLDAFRRGLDPYKQMGSWIYNDKPLDQITKAERNDGKLAELSCQYGLGWRSLKKQAKQKAGRVLTDDQAKHIVDTYRRTHAAIKRRWYELEEAAHRAVREPGTIREVGPIAFRHDGQNLKMRLPVGRCITFQGARIEMRQPPWDTDELRPVLVYWGEDSVTHQWTQMTAWGGDFMAISCQGMSRDLVAHALVRLEEETFCPVLTVHDEIAGDVPDAPGNAVSFTQIMCDLPPWARTLPVKAETFTTFRYRK